ncbi:hypothetical protein VP1G_03264 [Cytospora mali]|uniref:Glycine zipper 2TM domain-containing protein n=1 Tax=Cytospora mali TaxID=578113 RepID=A0A194UW33_CYTMA|nr:hypothetical protein VP1G_03264 [Valsa mali var. pyri (nom. inval.)]
MSAADYYGQSGGYTQQAQYTPPQQQQYASTSHLTPYSQTPNPYQRPTSAHSANVPYGSSTYAPRPSSAHSDMSGYVPPNQQQYAGAPPPYQENHRQPGQDQEQDGEKGLMATVLGGGAGGALGHKMGKGSKFKTFLGAAAGAVAANIVEHKVQGSHNGHGNQGYGNQGHYGYVMAITAITDTTDTTGTTVITDTMVIMATTVGKGNRPCHTYDL